jgi:tight adherence protein B
VLLFGIAVPILAAGIAQESLSVPGLSLAVLVGAAAFEYELLVQQANRRQKLIGQAWPIVLESLESAATSGMSILESLRDLAESEQLSVSREFANCCAEIDSGIGISLALTNLKHSLSNPAADFTIELLKTTHEFGSAGYVSAIKNQSSALRLASNLESEIAAKQGWVVGTAKLAVAAPWLIVGVLSFRQENAQLYSSMAGTSLLLLGLVASAFALHLVYRIGQPLVGGRVFA